MLIYTCDVGLLGVGRIGGSKSVIIDDLYFKRIQDDFIILSINTLYILTI